MSEIGYKYNLMDLLSVIGIEQLKRLENNLKIRKNFGRLIINILTQRLLIFQNYGIKKIQHSYHLFNIYLNKKRDKISRDEAIIRLHKKKIGVGIHYRAIPDHSIYRKMFSWKIDDYPNAKKIGRGTLSLPLSPSLSIKELKRVINSINILTK